MAAVDAAGLDLEGRLRAALQRQPDVLVAYLFGSRTRGSAGALSDVDVAVLLRDDASRDLARRLALIRDLAAASGRDDVDLVILNEAPVSLAYRVLREGRLLLSRDEVARVRHRARTVDRYLDMEPFRRIHEQGLRRRLEKGSFGRP